MSLRNLEIKKFLAFRDNFTCNFCEGINIFIGGNGMGKTTLLKALYVPFAATKIKSPGIFGHNNPELIKITIDNDVFTSDKMSEIPEVFSKTESVFIPTIEMLSHSKGFLAMCEKYNMPFDRTQVEILINAQLPETKEISKRNQKLLEMIIQKIGGNVVYENDTFYILKQDGSKIEFSYEAEGFKKLGLLWKLIRNGLLESGSILLWDEPDTSINPELFPLIADILYILKNDGVQIFLATHNYQFSKYIDLKKQNENDVLFISLYKDDKGLIKTSRAKSYSDLKNNSIESASENLYNAVVEKAKRG